MFIKRLRFILPKEEVTQYLKLKGANEKKGEQLRLDIKMFQINFKS